MLRIFLLLPLITHAELLITKIMAAVPFAGNVSTTEEVPAPAPLTSCAPASVYPERGEYVWGCIGAAEGGNPYVFHAPKAGTTDEMEMMVNLQMWPCNGGGNGMGKICYSLSNGEMRCFGEDGGNPPANCVFEFQPNDRLIDLTLHGNGYGTRFGRMQFNVNRDGKSVYFNCGCGGDPYKVTSAAGAQLAGFHLKAGLDIDNLGPLLVIPKCHIISQEIVDIQCKDPGTGGNCMAAWTESPGDQYYNLEAICDACEAPPGNSHCEFTFLLRQTHSVMIGSSYIDSLGSKVTIGEKVSASFKYLGVTFGGEISTAVEVSYSHSWENSKSQTSQDTKQIQTKCSYELPPGYKLKAVGTARMGNMVADMVYTVRTVTDCGDDETVTTDGQTTISNVAVLAAVMNCKYKEMACVECPRPETGCDAPTDVYQKIDCDKDGFMDHLCTSTSSDSSWVALSKPSCPTGWVENTPGMCPHQCPRPSTGCSAAGAVYVNHDCDGDGILDHFCDSGDKTWVVLSSAGCPANWVENKSGACVPLATECTGWTCTIEGQFCPEGVPGSTKGGYCCKSGSWVAGSCAVRTVRRQWMGVAVPAEKNENCEEAGYEYINNPRDCEQAANDLGLTYYSATSYKPAPQGCYGRPGMGSTGEFSYHPENAGVGAVGERYPICKNYINEGVDTLAAPRSPKTCLKFKQIYNGKPSNIFNTEHIRDCFIACQIAGKKKCAGWSWLMHARQPCRLFKKKTIENKGLKVKTEAISADRDCHPDRA